MNCFNAFLIGTSQLINVVIGSGDPDQMICSWAWENKDKSYFAAKFSYFVDNYLWPLSTWRDGDWTHCESCWHYERKRILEKAEAFKVEK